MEEILEYVYEFLDREGEYNSKEKNIKVLIEYFALNEILAEQIYKDWKKKFMKAKYEVSEV
ncbi:hypothetical protein [Clostridium baratii]|uniref:hypothetical protein n=1 Tax=Clostridium baratii TaxID=1561 RepID=UPI0030D11138